MDAAPILQELEGLGLTFQAINGRLAHQFHPRGSVDGDRMCSLLVALNYCRSQALSYLNQGKVIPFPKGRGKP